MAVTEPVLNAKLAEILRSRHPAWDETNVHVESTGLIHRHPHWQVDILFENPHGLPVALEAKFEDSRSAIHGQIVQRIGKRMTTNQVSIEGGISLVYPNSLKDGKLDRMATMQFQYAVHQLNAKRQVTRFPENPNDWLWGNASDLASAIEIVSLSEALVAESESLLEEGVRIGSQFLRMRLKATGASRIESAIAGLLQQEQCDQTMRMAVAILLNAIVFQYALEESGSIPATLTYKDLRKGQLCSLWENILNDNYWPVFGIAIDLLNQIPTTIANELIPILDDTSQKLVRIGATKYHDLSGRMFQSLIADRKFLATFYTLPTSAMLIAELALSLVKVDWSNSNEILNLRIADFACGTGALLTAIQRGIYRRYRRTGQDDSELHQGLMEHVLTGTDIMPAAAHLTASILSSAHPRVPYGTSLIHALRYGRATVSKNENTSLGALDFLTDEFGQSIYFLSDSMQIDIGGKRMLGKLMPSEEKEQPRFDIHIEHSTCDLVIMNPPFTRPTNHEGLHASVAIPSFAGFSTSAQEQQNMSMKLKLVRRGIGHGNAGIASYFLELAHKKLKVGGVMALILPFSFLRGSAWGQARSVISRGYEKINIVSVVSSHGQGRSFSADTGMAECILVARKKNRTSRHDEVVRYFNLSEKPTSLFESSNVAANTISGKGAIEGTLLDSGSAGAKNNDVARFVSGLARGALSFARDSREFSFPITKLGELVRFGSLHRDINGLNRGPFDIIQQADRTSTFPALWSHHAGKHDGVRERLLVVDPDSFGRIRQDMQEKARTTWSKSASRLHHNLDFQLNSQSLAACITSVQCLGGQAWPSLLGLNSESQQALVLWTNSTLGLFLFWWFGNRTQLGRARMSRTTLSSMATLDVKSLSSDQLVQSSAAFDKLRGRALLPANESYRDETRRAIDVHVFEILGIPHDILSELDHLRFQWCAEPSVHGGKNTQPDVAFS